MAITEQVNSQSEIKHSSGGKSEALFISGDVIPPKATLTFLVRLVQINDDWWKEEAEAKKVLAWETEFRPEPCEVVASYSDNLYIHYRATRSEPAPRLNLLKDICIYIYNSNLISCLNLLREKTYMNLS